MSKTIGDGVAESAARVLFLVPELSIGGTERQVMLLSAAMRSQGHAVRIVALRSPRRPLAADSSVDIVQHNTRSYDPRSFHIILRDIRSFKPGVVQTFLFGFDLFANLAARRGRVACVCSARRQLATWRGKRHLAMQNAANLFVDAVITNSLAAADYCCSKERFVHRGMVYTIPNAFVPLSAEPGLKRPLPPRPGYCIVNVANFWPGKGHDVLVRAFAQFAARFPEAGLWLVGDGPTRRLAEALAGELGVSKRLQFLGQRNDIRHILQQADVYAHASAMESSPNSILEAMGAGVPVVASACGGVTELLAGGEAGLLVAPGAPAEFAAAIAHARLHPDKMRGYALEARNLVSTRHDVGQVASRYLAVYRSVAAEKDRNPGSRGSKVCRIGLYTIGDIGSPSTRYRVLQYVPRLQESGFVVRHYALPGPRAGKLFGAVGLLGQGVRRGVQLLRFGAHDLCIVQKGLTPAHWRLLPALLRSRAPFVLDVDDAVFDALPIRMPFPFFLLQDPKEVGVLARLAAHALVGNTTLASMCPCESCSVVPTTIDPFRFPDLTWRAYRRDPSAIRLVWTGQRSTLPYLLEVLDPLRAAAAQAAPRKLILRVICDDFAAIERRKLDPLILETVPWTLEGEVAALSVCDIGLMPLREDEWSRAKCGLKLLCYLCCGIPSIASPVGVNETIVRDGQNALLAGSAGDWCEKVTLAATDDALRQRLASRARASVAAGYTPGVWWPDLLQTLRGMTACLSLDAHL